MLRVSAATGILLLLLAGGCGRAAGPGAAQPQPGASSPAPAWLGPLQVIETPAGPGARYPHLAAAPGGRPLLMSWLEPGSQPGEFGLRQATWQSDRRWSPAREVVAGADWFINWADFPSVVPVDERRWIAHWLQQRPGGVYSYDVGAAERGRRRELVARRARCTTTAPRPSTGSYRSQTRQEAPTRSGSTDAIPRARSTRVTRAAITAVAR